MSTKIKEILRGKTTGQRRKSSSQGIEYVRLEVSPQSPPLIKSDKDENESSNFENDDFPSSDSDRTNSRNEIFGLVYMAASAFAFSLMSLLVSITSSGDNKFPSFQLVFARSIIQMLLSCVYMILRVSKNPFGPSITDIRWLLILRGASGSIGLALFYYGLSVLSLSDAIVIFFIGPTFTVILASLVLKEPLDKVDVISSISCLLGVALVSRPGFIFHDEVPEDGQSEFSRGLAVILLLLGAVMSAVAFVTVRTITKRTTEVHAMVHVFYFGFVSSIFSPICLFVFQTPVIPKDLLQYLSLIAVGLLAFTGQILLNRGLQLAPAGPGSIMRNLDIVFAFLYDILLLHKSLKWTSYVGASIILFFTCLVGMRRWRKRVR